MKRIMVIAFSVFVLVSCVESVFEDKTPSLEANFTNLAEEPIKQDVVLNNDDIYYITPYGKKYHCADCSYIKRDLSECRKFSDVEAEEKGYSPCSRCIG